MSVLPCLPDQLTAEHPNSQISSEKKPLQYVLFRHGTENMAWHHLCPSPTFPSFQCCIPPPAIQSASSGEEAVSHLRFPANLTSSFSKMCNPRWEQRAPTCKPTFAFSKTQFRPDQTYNYPRPSILSVSRLFYHPRFMSFQSGSTGFRHKRQQLPRLLFLEEAI